MNYKLNHTSDTEVIKNFNTIRDTVEFSPYKFKNNNQKRIKLDKSNIKSKYKDISSKLPMLSPKAKLSLSEMDESSLNLPFQSFRQQSKFILDKLDLLTSLDEESRKRKVNITNGIKISNHDHVKISKKSEVNKRYE